LLRKKGRVKNKNKFVLLLRADFVNCSASGGEGSSARLRSGCFTPLLEAVVSHRSSAAGRFLRAAAKRLFHTALPLLEGEQLTKSALSKRKEGQMN
jgi:hypothetical protein